MEINWLVVGLAIAAAFLIVIGTIREDLKNEKEYVRFLNGHYKRDKYYEPKEPGES